MISRTVAGRQVQDISRADNIMNLVHGRRVTNRFALLLTISPKETETH